MRENVTTIMGELNMSERTRQQVAKMASKTHFRSYKDGKRWLVASISSLGLAVALLGAGTTQAEATTGDTNATNNEAGQTTPAGGVLNQQKVSLSHTAGDGATARSSNNEMKADTTPASASGNVSDSEVTVNGKDSTEATAKQAVSTDKPSADATSDEVDDVQTYNLGTASDEVADATKTQAEEAYADTGQPQKITRMAAEERAHMGSVTINMETTDGELIISEKAKVPLLESFTARVPNTLVVTQEQVDDLKTRIAEVQANGSEEDKDSLPEISDNAAGRYEYVGATYEPDEFQFDAPMLSTYFGDLENYDYVFTVIYKKLPILTVNHVYTDGSDATGNTGKPKQVILSVDDPVDQTTTNKESLTVTFGDDDQANITMSKTADNDADQDILSDLLSEDGIHGLSNATIQENLRSVGIRMDGTVDDTNTDLSPAITKVTFVYDKDTPATTPVTDPNQDMMDTLKELYEQAMSDFGNDAKNEDEQHTGEMLPDNGSEPEDDSGDTPSVTQADVGIAFYIQNTETGEITPFEFNNKQLVDRHLYDEDTTLPLDMSFSYEGVNYRYVGYEIAPADGTVDGSKLNPDNEIPIKTGTPVAGVDENGNAVEIAPTTLFNAIYKIVPAETTANYIYDDAEQTKIEPTQVVTTDQDSDVTLPTTNLEKIVLTSSNGKGGVPTTLTLKFNSDFTVTHLILDEGTKNELALPAAYETLGALLDNNADGDLRQATLDGLASQGIDENSTSPDAYEGFLANLAKTGIHINGNVAIVDPEIINQLSDVTYVYAAPEKQTVTVQAIDDATGNVLETAELTGYPVATTTYDTQPWIDKYTPLNYVVAANEIPAVITFDDDSTAAQVYQLHLVHHVTHSTAETTQTVTFTDEAGNIMAPSVVETITWNISTDDVTGEKVATAQKGYEEVEVPVITGYVATPSVVAANYPVPTAGELQNTNVQVIYKKATAGNADTGDPVTPSNPDVTQPTTDQPTVAQPNSEQPTVVELIENTAPEKEQLETTKQPAGGVKADSEGAETPASEVVSSNKTVANDSDTTEQRLPQTAERDGQTNSVLGMVMAGMLSLLGLVGLRKKRD